MHGPTNYVPPAVAQGVHYTSDAMEEDFSTSVELLMNAIGFLKGLVELDDHYDHLSIKARGQLDEHIEAVEEFLGQWQND